MGDFKLAISEEAVNTLVKAASDLEQNKNAINNEIKALHDSFDQNKGGMDPVLASLQNLIEDLDETTQGGAILPLIAFEKKLLVAAKWRAEKLSGEELKVKKLTLSKHR